MLLSESELTAMRADVAQMLPQTAVISAPTWVSDGSGGGTVTHSAVTGGTVACRLDPLSLRSKEASLTAGQETLLVGYRATFPYDAPLAQNYQVVVDSHTYQIMQLDADHAQRVSRRAILQEMR